MIHDEVIQVFTELYEKARVPAGSLIVVGCSTSEIAGGHIGKNIVPEIGADVARAVIEFAKARGLYPAFQCCEHLNRALVVEREALDRYGLTEVCVRPMPNAGGSCAAAAYDMLDNPAIAEAAQAVMGVDIGDTLIGMHLKPVAVPFRGSVVSIGHAHVTAAYSRPKLIGGERARYA